MVNLINAFTNFRTESKNIGHAKALINFGYLAANKIVDIRRFEIIVLKRENLLPIDPQKYLNFNSRLAHFEDLKDMEAEGKWQITEELKEAFKNGDNCLLSFIDEKLAGYTWVHTAGHPLLISGLRISVPKNYGYNYAGFTLPEFRGSGLQPYRHHEILNRPEWTDKTGMIGYVDTTNWSSKKGQAKSGYQRLGDLVIIGSDSNLKVVVSNELKQMGIIRLND